MVPLVLVRHALHVAQKCNDANTQNQKKWKLILILLTTETNRKLKQWWYSTGNSSNGGTQQETRAMVVLNKKLEQWWYSTGKSSNGGTQHETRAMVVLNRRETRAMVVLNTGRNSSNGGTQQNETHRDDTRDNQTCVKSGLRPRIRRGSSGYRKNGSGC